MKIKTWIKYSESYLPTPRCKKLRYRDAEEYIYIDLQETAAETLKLAFAVEFIEHTDIYSYNGKLWKKADIRDVCAGEENERYKTPLEALKWWNKNGSQYFTSYNENGTDWRGNGEKKWSIKQAKEDMKKYLLVDNELYAQVYMPYYQVCVFGFGNNHGGTGLLVNFDHNIKKLGKNTFLPTEGKAAVDYAIKTARERGDTDDIPRFKEMITVYMPELVKNKKRINDFV